MTTSLDWTISFSEPEKEYPMHYLPPTTQHHPIPWHTCKHPALHRIGMLALQGAWLYWSLAHGWRWAAMQSQYFAPGVNLVMLVVLGAGWVLLVVPGVCGALYALGNGHCGMAQGMAMQHQARRPHTIERIIFSPEAAAQRFGVRGTVTLERETDA
jgi:hypothetical protein